MNRKPQLIPQGEDRKLQVALSNLPDGVSMDTVDVTFTVSSGHSSIDFTRAQLCKTADGKYYLPVETSKLSIGDLKLSAHVRIPDDDFTDGVRNEYPEFDLNVKIVQR